MLEKIERAGFKRIADLEYAVRQSWKAACKHDGIEPGSKFVVFSDDNPFVKFKDAAQRELWEARAMHVPGGGYVGLTIKNGRAVI